jgi:hypothetical integral membrane protein (TIGR02206 family)
MNSHFKLFGFAHLAIVAAVPALAFALARVAQRGRLSARRVATGLGIFLLVNESIWYAFKFSHEGLRFPEGMPLQLSLWLTIFVCLLGRPWMYDVAYYIGLAGAGMAVVTPDLWEPFPSYPTIYFFLAHGGIVVALLALAWGGLHRPRHGSVWRAFGALSLYAIAIGAYNAIFKTNYMYLCRKPLSATLLDRAGPWPIYLIAGEFIALAAFALLWLPWRSRTMRPDGC